MSLDLYREEAEQAIDRFPRTPIGQVEVPFFHNPIIGGLKVAAEGAAKTARAVSMLAAPVAVLADQALSGYGNGTEIQDRFFQQHQEFFDSAVKYWTPKPDEVGMAGQIVGSLASMLPLVMAGPGGAATAVGSQVLSQAEDLVEKGVPADKAVGVGVVQGAGLATGIWMPILGQNLWQRVVLGGAGFNVLQGVTTRAGSQLILEGEKAAEMFPTFDAKMLTLDLLLGMAFGGVAHVSPEMRAQGKDVWARIANWAENLTPEQVDALAAVRQAEHMNAETAPGVLRTPADVEANVNRVKSALESLLRDEAPQVDAMPKPSLEPDRARQVDAETRVGELRADVSRVAAEEGIPELQAAAEPVVRGMPEGWVEMAKLPVEEQPAAIGGAIERRLVELGVQADEAAANGAIWRAFFDTASRKYGVQAAELMRDYGIDLQRMRAAVPGADAALATGDATGYGGGRGRLEQTAGTRPEPEVLQRTAAGGSPEPGWVGATRISRAGRPLPFYRGSELELAPEHFDVGSLGVASGNPSSGLGVWFTNTRSEAGTFGKVQEAYLDIRNPLVVKIEDLPGFGSVAEAHAWREAQRAKGHDGLVITAKHLGGKTHVVAFDAKQVVPIGGHGEYAQGVKPGPMFYSELARQIQTLPESRVPAEGLTAAEWKALLIEPESRRTVAIRDEKNRPTGKTREVVSPEKVRLPGVVMDEIKWSGLQEWLELQGSEAARAKGWATARFEPKREGGDIGTIVNGEGKMLLGIISRADAERTIREQQALSSGKITRQQVSDFLEQNGVRVDEVMMGGKWQRTPADAAIAEDRALLESASYVITENPEHPGMFAFMDEEGGDIVSAAEIRQFAEQAKAEGNINPGDEEVFAQLGAAAQRVEDYLMRPSHQEIQDRTRYSQYQLPGAKEGSYRELLLTLPLKPQPLPDVSMKGWSVETVDENRYTGQRSIVIVDPSGNHVSQRSGFSGTDEEAIRHFAERAGESLAADRERSQTFNSSHWNEDNILAHVRFNERTDADGRRVLFVEEIQSDWAQQGKKKGFAGEGANGYRVEQRGDLWVVLDPNGEPVNTGRTQAEAQSWADRHASIDRGIPAAPFVQKTEAWVGLVLKRMIRYAAENGFDSVAWTRGEQQVDRYTGALRKAVDSIEWTKTPDGVQIVGYKGKDDAPVYEITGQDGLGIGMRGRYESPEDAAADYQAVTGRTLQEDGLGVQVLKRASRKTKVVDTTEKETALSDAIGKSMAERIINDPAQSGTIEGENIRVDDTGMASFYDRIVPNVANQLLKKLGGGKVRELGIEIPTTSDKLPELREATDAEMQGMQGLEEFDNGTRPVMAETRLLVGGSVETGLVVVDRAGVHILLNNGETEALIPRDDILAHMGANVRESMTESWVENKDGAALLVKAYWDPNGQWSMWGLAQVIRGEPVEIRPAPAETPQQQGFDLTPQMRERALGGQTLFQRAYHGSRSIHDKFTLQKIGTGEGAQVYGWGLYFSSLKKIGDWYRKNLAGEEIPASITVHGNPLDWHGRWYREGPEWRKLGALELHARMAYYTDEATAISSVRQSLEGEVKRIQAARDAGRTVSGNWNRDSGQLDAAEAALRVLDEGGIGFRPRQKPGRTYEVEIPEQKDMLDWDKPAHSQQKLSEAWVQFGAGDGMASQAPPVWMRGKDAYEAMVHAVETRPEFEEQMIDWYRENIDPLMPETKYYLHFAEGPNAKQRYEADERGRPVVFDSEAQALAYAAEKRMPKMEVMEETLDQPAVPSAPEMVSRWLDREHGIKGITYKGLTSGERNFVVFDDSAIQIVGYDQANRGQITFRDGSTVIGLFEGANASTFVHESGHLFLQITRDLALRADAPAAAVADWARLEQWLGIEGGEINTAAHEQFARGWEKYLAEGEAPTPELRTVFQQFRDWLLQVYRTLTELDVKLTDEIRGVMDRMLASEAADPTPARARATTEAEGAPAPTGRDVPPPPRAEAGEARATPEAPEEPDPWLAVADAKAAAEPAPQLGLENEDVRAILLVMAETEAGWAEIGGRHLGGEMGQPNFSAWVPRADWWPQREGKLNEAQTKEAVRKALAGEKLKKKEQLAIDYMVKIAAERATDVGMVGKDEWDLTAEAVHAEDLEPTTRNVVDAALVGRAMEISEGAVERLAVMYEADDAGFMAAVRRMIDAHHEESRRIRQDLEAARSRQEAGSGQPGPAGAGPEGAAAPAAGAGRAAGGDTGRPAGEPQGPAAVEGEAAQPDPLRQAAEDFVATNPGRHIMVGTNEDGTPRYVTAEEYLAEARAQAELARQDVGLFEVAARCMLGGS